jgi:ankyrin repeat protein
MSDTTINSFSSQQSNVDQAMAANESALLPESQQLQDPTETQTIVEAESNNTPQLHILAQQGDIARIRELLDAGECKATDVDAEGITALHWAAMNSALDVCRLLLERGAEVDAVGGELQATPLHWATR